MIEQCHIYASPVGGIGDEILITGIPQEGTVGEVVNHGVILHLHEGYQVGNGPFCPFSATGDEFLSYIIDLVPVTLGIPSACAAFAEFEVILQAVVTAVEEIFAVQLYYGEDGEEEMEHCWYWKEMIVKSEK